MIYLDFDGVIADLHPEWIRRLNELHGTDYTAEDITDWGCSFLPLELHDSWFRILNHADLYDNVEAIPGALGTISWLDKHQIPWSIATSCGSEAMVAGKIDWLIRHGIAKRCRGGWPNNFIPIRDKSLLRGKLLVDDGIHNLEGFHGLRLLFDQPHNRKETRFARVKGWAQGLDFLKAFTKPLPGGL